MKRIDLASPFPREREVPHLEFGYAIEKTSYLPQPDGLPDFSFDSVLASRRSRRTFKSLSQDHLTSILWYAARALEVSSPTKSVRWQHRPTPSGGGRHPIDILIFEGQQPTRSVYLYQPESHALAKLKVLNTLSLEKFSETVDGIVAREQSTMLWFGAQFERTLSRYENGESLVWRDAGALLATISLVAECLSLNCCAIGITGEPFISEILASHRSVIGVGGLLVGQR